MQNFRGTCINDGFESSTLHDLSIGCDGRSTKKNPVSVDAFNNVRFLSFDVFSPIDVEEYGLDQRDGLFL